MAGRDGLRTVFAHPGYRWLWTARTASQAGDVFNTVALSLLVLRLTGSGLGVSAVVAAEIAPVLLWAPLAGTLVDRVPRVGLMIGADLARAGPGSRRNVRDNGVRQRKHHRGVRGRVRDVGRSGGVQPGREHGTAPSLVDI